MTTCASWSRSDGKWKVWSAHGVVPRFGISGCLKPEVKTRGSQDGVTPLPSSANNSVVLQPVFTKLLSRQRYIDWGDLSMTLDDQNSGYNLPLSVRFGKVFKAGKQPINIFVQPQYTPDGFHSGPTAKYGVKLSMSFLLPGASFGYSKEEAARRACRRGCVGRCHCR